MTLLYSDQQFLLHETGRHPECAERLKHVHAKLKASELLERATSVPIQRATDEDVLRVHTTDHIASVRQARQHPPNRD